LLSAPLTSRASVVWRGDFETGDTSQWPTIHGLPERLTIVTSPVRQGQYALRTELRNGDWNNNGNRNEVVWNTAQKQGTDRYYAWSTMFSAEYPAESKWQVFTQWHHSGLTGSPPLEMDVYANEIRLVSGGSTVRWSANLVRGVWHDFVVHVYWSADSSAGFVELWYDGNKALEKTYLATTYSGQDTFFVQGLYRDSSIVPPAVVWHDGATVATALVDVLPPPPAPPPPDAGSPDAGTPPPAPDGGAPAGSSSQPPATPPAAIGGFPGGGCGSAGASVLAACGLGALLSRRGRRRRR
jgi:hypothetical protein